MGCIYPSSTLSSFQSELKAELNTSRSDLLSKNRLSHQTATFNQRTNQLNLNFSENIQNIKAYSNYTKSSSMDPGRYFMSNSKKFIPRLSLEKFNELFDDSTIECYNKKENDYLHFSFKKAITNIYKKNKEESLNSTYERTAENTFESEYYNGGVKSKKKEKNKKLVF